MHKGVRRRFFYLLLFLFFVISPLLIAYSLGYNFNFLQARIEKTGGIFIKSKTSRISIFLNGTFQKETSLFSGGAVLTDTTPAMYLLRLEKSGYQPWSKTVLVEPSIVTELRNIILLPKPLSYAPAMKEELILFPPKNISSQLSLDKKNNLSKKEGRAKKILASNVDSFAGFEDVILFVDKNGFLAKLDPASSALETIGRPGFYLKGDNKINFVRSAGSAVAILDASGGLFLLEDSSKIIALRGGVAKVYFDVGGTKLLLVKEHGLEILWLVDNTEQPFQKKGTFEEIIKSGSPLREARWFYGDNAHLVIRTDDGLFLTEIDGRGGRNTAELLSGKTDEVVTSENFPNKIFFRKGKIWQKIEL